MMRQRGYAGVASQQQTTTTMIDENNNIHTSSYHHNHNVNHHIVGPSKLPQRQSSTSNNDNEYQQQVQPLLQQQHDDADVAAGSRRTKQQHHHPLLGMKSASTGGDIMNRSTSVPFSTSPPRGSSSSMRFNDIGNSNIGNNINLTTGPTTSVSSSLHPVDSMATIDTQYSIETAPSSVCTINSVKGNTGDLEFFEDMITEPVLVLGIDISHLPLASQFSVCAAGLFFFSLLYGYLQELLSVQLCSRQLGLFLAMTQFTGYTVLAYIMRNFVYKKQQSFKQRMFDQQALLLGNSSSDINQNLIDDQNEKRSKMFDAKHVPLALYLGLSLLRAIDLAMTNLAMQYINYPAKTLMKSSRVVFTMLFGALIQRKVYKTADYMIVVAMVAGLATFMHADANSSAVFHHLGVIMLVISLFCDGAISNVSETIMNQFGVGQDEFIFRLYSISLLAITFAAAVKGDFYDGMIWMLQPGTYQQFLDNAPMSERVWSAPSKVLILVLFSSMGFFGSSCSAAITKNFGALTMSITSTARKATTLFLSFFLFNNVCTWEHIAGISMFITALTAKSLRRRHHSQNKQKKRKKYQRRQKVQANESELPPFMIATSSLPPSTTTTPERLTFRYQRVNSHDGTTGLIDTNQRSDLVHVV